MSALDLISLISQVLFVGLSLAVLVHAVRQPTRARLNTLLLFGTLGAVVILGWLDDRLGLDAAWVTPLTIALISVVPFAMLRLVDDFRGTPGWVQWVGGGMLVAVTGLAIAYAETNIRLVEIVLIAWFVGVGGYAAAAFAGAAAKSRGITRRRMAAVAVGAVTFIAAFALILVGALVEEDALRIAGQTLALLSVLSFFLGFAPPPWIRRAWREPELRRFLQGAVRLTSLSDDRRALVELQRSTADAFGASGAAIGLSDPERSMLRFVSRGGEWSEIPDHEYIGGRAFREQRRIVALDATRDDPAHADAYRQTSAKTVIAAPMTTEDRRVGVLLVYADRAPIFIEDDLWLLELLADHTAVVLEARALAADEASIRSREDAARLKEEFLSAAAHDLRTPLTVVLGQAELLERRVARDPSAPADAPGIARIAREARRLRDLISQLLDVQRLEQGSAVIERADIDLREVLDAVHERYRDHGLDLRLRLPETAAIAAVDRGRLEQVIENLVENALKYTPSGDLPEIRMTIDGGEALISVIDRGVGIPADERDRIFERFYRAANVQSVTDTGMGLGLYICRRIIEAHDGRIWVDSAEGGGSTFTVALSARAEPASEAETADPAWPVAGLEAKADA